MLQQHGEREGTELGLAATAAWEKNSTFPQQFSNNLLTIALFCYVTYVGCVVAWRTAWHQPQGTAPWLRPEWGTAPRRLLHSPAWATHPVQRRLQLAQTWWNLGVLTPLLNAIQGSSLCPVQGKALLHPTQPCAPQRTAAQMLSRSGTRPPLTAVCGVCPEACLLLLRTLRQK